MRQSGLRRWLGGVRWRHAKVWVALAIALCTAWTAQPKIYDAVTAELVAVVALLMAGVLPAAILSATVLRSGGFTVQKLGQFRDALLRQVNVWAGLFLLSFATCSFLIVGKISGWAILIPTAWMHFSQFDDHLDLSAVLIFFVTFSLCLLALRVIVIFSGIRSLVILSADIAISEVQDREDAALLASAKAIEEMPQREGFGRQIEISR